MTTLLSSRLSIPYPDGTERVMDGDNAMGAIANHLDDLTKAGVPWRMAAGVMGTSALAADTGVQGSVTFPASRFPNAPIVAVAHDSTGYTFGNASGVTATGFTGRAYNPTSTATTGTGTLRWLAVYMTPGAANG